MVAPFYPQVMDEKGVGSGWIGIIFAVQPTMMFMTTAMVTKYLKELGRRNSFLFGVFCEVVALF